MLWSVLSAVIGFFAGAAAAAGAALVIATCARAVKARRSRARGIRDDGPR